MRVFLVHKFNPGLVFEVLEYDKAKHSAELRTRHGAQVTDPCFSLDEPRNRRIVLKGNDHAIEPGL